MFTCAAASSSDECARCVTALTENPRSAFQDLREARFVLLLDESSSFTYSLVIKFVSTHMMLLAVLEVTVVMFIIPFCDCSRWYCEKNIIMLAIDMCCESKSLLENQLVYFDETQFIETNVFSKCFGWCVDAAAWDWFNIIIYHPRCLLSFSLTVPSGRAIKDSLCGRSAGLFCQTSFEKKKKTVN